MTMEHVLPVIAGVIFIFLFIKIFSTPIKWILKLLLNAALGFVLLIVINFFGSYIGLSISVGWISALVAGLLGVPGIILLILIETFFV